MLKQLLAATAIVTVATAAQAAQTVNTTGTTAATQSTVSPTATSGDVFLASANASERLATKLIGMDVYDSTAPNANKIGTVSDLVIGDNGQIDAAIVGVGGFLGIGQKNVAVNFPDLQWQTPQNGGNPILVASITKDELTNAPSFDTAAIDNAMQPANANGGAGMTTAQNATTTSTGTTTVPAAGGTLGVNGTTTTDLAQQNTMTNGTNAMTAQNGNMANGTATNPATTNGNPDKSSLTPVDLASLSAKDLMNATVYGADNSNIGNVSDVLLGQDKKIDALVLNVGGFLGLGTKPVAIGFDSLDIRKDANGGLYIYTGFTKDQLDAAPAYDKNTYASQRDTMRLTNP